MAGMSLGLGLGLSFRQSPYAPEAMALFSRMSTQPDTTRKGHINTLIATLKAGGVWDNLDVFYVMAAHDAQAASLEWKGNAAYNLVPVNSPAFTADVGYVGNGTNAYLTTGYNPTSASLGYALNSAHAGIYVWADSASTFADVVAFSGATVITSITARGAANGNTRINRGSGALAFSGVPTTPRHMMAIRRDATNQYAFLNGLQNTTAVGASTSIPNGAFTFLGSAAPSSGDRPAGAAHIGKSLTDAQALTLSNALAAYFASTSSFSMTTSGLDATVLTNGVAADTKTLDAATNVRYDVYWFDPATAVYGVTKGTDAILDAGERIPVLTGTRRALFNMRVASGAITYVPVWNIEGGQSPAYDTAIEAEHTRSRALLPNLLAKIAAREPIHIVCIGDSIMAMQSNTPSLSVPNGTVRDAALVAGSYMAENLGSDLTAPYGSRTSIQLGRADDGGGAIHTRFGYIWELVSAYEAAGGTVFYDNFAKAGTSSGTAAGAAWMDAAAALGADVAIIGFGMNEYSSGTTETNIASIVDEFQSGGVETIVMGVARKPADASGWRTTEAHLKAAAYAAGSAFVPLTPIYEDDALGVIGVVAVDHCSANAINHPGIREHQAIGRELARLLQLA